MLGSKLLELISQLSPKETKDYCHFVASPFFNEKRELDKLALYISKYAPTYSSPKLEKEVAWKAALPGQNYDDKQMGYMMSDLVKLLEQFLAVGTFINDPLELKLRTLRALEERESDKLFDSYLRRSQKEIDKRDELETNTYLKRFELYSLKNIHFDRQRTREFDESLQQAIDELDTFYLINKLRYSCEIFNRKNVVSADYQVKLLDEILQFVQKEDYDRPPLVNLYYYALMTLTDSEDESHFEALKQSLTQYLGQVKKEEARYVYGYAVNYCAKKINRGNFQYFKEIFELYKMGLESEVVFDGRFLSPWTYKNIVSVSLRLGEFEWTHDFIESYLPKLRKRFQENAYVYNMATFHFEQQQYEEAQLLLNQIEFTDVYYALGARAMLLRIYYELGEVEPLMSLLDSFKVYLQRNKHISDYQRTIYQNLLRFTRKLLKLKVAGNKEIEACMAELESTKEVAYSNWVKQKLSALKS